MDEEYEKKVKSIELFFFDGCPSWNESLKNLKAVLREVGIKNDVTLIRVETHHDAVSNRFPGSPTIKINGNDIFPVGGSNYALGCRVYKTPEGFKGSPTMEMISKRLSEILNRNK